MPRQPNTRAQVWYSYAIRARGRKVGTLQSFTPRSTRTVERIREIANNGGAIIEQVPNVTDYTIDVQQILIYKQDILEALGYDNLVDLQDIQDPIDVVETINNPDGTTNTVTYKDCWITSINKTIVNTTAHVVANATLQPTAIIPGTVPA